VKFLGPAVDNGDPQQQMAAVLDGWHRDRLVPVWGRDVQFFYRKHGVSSAEESRAACVGFAEEDKVFAVGAMAVFPASECVAKEYRIPIVTTEMLTEPQLQRGAPYIFSARPSMNRMLRNWVHWADSRRLLQGKQLGLLYYSGNPTPDNEGFVKDVRAELAKLGYHLTDQAALDGSQSSITVAVQHFRTSGVDLVMPVINSIDQTTFIEQADAQAYRPTYIDSDFQFNTFDLLSAGKHDGTYAMEIVRYGEQNAGMGLPAEGTACVRNYERYAGKTVAPKSTEEDYTLTGCDTAAMLLKGLQSAGRNLTPEAFIAGLEKIRNLPMALNGPYTSLYPNRHHGGESQRTMIFKSDCRCWWALGAFAPLYVP
jgi:ABC-type branched-subunit amino acid transport system substrate-binding protein